MVFVIFFALCFLPVIPECFYQGSRCFFWLCLKRKANCWIPALKTLPEWRSSGWCLLSFFALCFSLVIPECFYQGSRCFFWLCLKRKNNCWIPAQQRYRNDGLNTWIPALKTLPEWRSSWALAERRSSWVLAERHSSWALAEWHSSWRNQNNLVVNFVCFLVLLYLFARHPWMLLSGIQVFLLTLLETY